MIRALYSAASGMTAQQINVDNIANNLANANTAGYKMRRAQFEDLIYQNMIQPGAAAGQQTTVPAGLQLGLGTRAASNEIIFSQGAFTQTNNPLDLVIQGKGFFQILQPTGELAYTRAGNFQLDRNGNVVDANGNPLQPQITIPPTAQSITVAQDGFNYAHDLVTRYFINHSAATSWMPLAYFSFLSICVLTTLDSGYLALKWFLGSTVEKSQNMLVSLVPKQMLGSPIPSFMLIGVVTLFGIWAKLELEYFMVAYASFFVGYAALAIARCFVPNSQQPLPQIRMFSMASMSIVIFAFGYLNSQTPLLLVGSLLPLVYVLWLVFNTDLLRVATERAGEVMEAAAEIPHEVVEAAGVANLRLAELAHGDGGERHENKTDGDAIENRRPDDAVHADLKIDAGEQPGRIGQHEKAEHEHPAHLDFAHEPADHEGGEERRHAARV